MSNEKELETAEATEATEVVEEVIEKPYTLRNLKDGDLFPMLRILKKIGIKDFKEAFTQIASGKKSIKEVGISVVLDMADIIVSNIDKAESDIYNLYSDIAGVSVDEMKEMEFGTLPLMIYDSFSGVKNTSFFKVLSKLL